MKPIYFLVAAATLFACADAQLKLSHSNLLRRRNTTLIVKIEGSLDAVAEGISTRSFATRGARLQALKRGLQAATRRFHEPVLRGLRDFGVDASSFWITNEILVRGADPDVVLYLIQQPTVLSIMDEPKVYLRPMQVRQAPPPGGENERNIELVNAPQAWNRTRGEGVVVGIIDSGARVTHEAIRDNWRGINDYGWFDGVWGMRRPRDNSGHGTHCVGVSTGRNGIGVAPRANWIACRACDVIFFQTVCPGAALRRCGEFMLCPTDPAGNNEDCSKAPHVISNSWGGGQGDDSYADIIRRWRNAGISNAFAIGNNGRQGCGTANSPGDQPEAFSVGATNMDDEIADFSSRGPSVEGRMVPNITAPGVGINSAYNSGDGDYVEMSGTSMATPHVAGAIALLRSAYRNASVDQIEQLLIRNTVEVPVVDRCGNDNGGYPNNVYGYGRLDVGKAMAAGPPSS